MRDWRVLQEEDVPAGVPNSAAWNMERDGCLLEEVLANAAPPALRLYEWRRPAITIGKFQDAERTLRLQVCQDEHVPVARRQTGGRGIFHGDDLTVSIAVSLVDSGLADEASVIEIYRHFATGFVRAFHDVGVEAAIGPCGRDRAGEPRGDCFATISRADVIESSSGCKLLGAALHRRREAVLLQASIPLYREPHRFRELAARLFCGAVPALPVASAAGIDPGKLKKALIQRFSDVLRFPYAEPGCRAVSN